MNSEYGNEFWFKNSWVSNKRNVEKCYESILTLCCAPQRLQLWTNLTENYPKAETKK